ncbi:unnamed protein product [Strongylus vulgaris]|uniref:39S ribosomal protein L35, mitochondrial n=1 Tax=Strongylus vulgaris TaxID=40348 RepID=A0A3P7J987_STRVU|nr:unnamed protein product [Strongylus vulgaris]
MRMIPFCRNLLDKIAPLTVHSSRTIARIPHYEYHIRFSPKEGRKRPAQDVLDRFKRLGNGMWVRAHPGKNKLRYAKDKKFQETSLYYETCTKVGVLFDDIFLSIPNLQRFKRLGNGMWVRAHPGKNKLRYAKDKKFQETSLYYETCTKVGVLFDGYDYGFKEECEMLDKMMTPYWLRRHHYPNDPYAAYHVRHGISSPRVDDKGVLLRERRKVCSFLCSGCFFFNN